MDYITIFAVALSLSFDTFAVALTYGFVLNKILFRQALRVASIMGFFQGGLAVAGYFLGSVISDLLKSVDHCIALLLLSALGIRMIISGTNEKGEKRLRDYRSLMVLLTIAVGTSIDAFAVGISFAFLEINIWESGIIIAMITFLASMVAIRIGKSAGKKLGRRTEIIGGILLIIIGIKIFLEHILA